MLVPFTVVYVMECGSDTTPFKSLFTVLTAEYSEEDFVGQLTSE